MCLILFAYKTHPDFPLILVANRDEYHQRPSRALGWWAENSDILAGKDLESHGTWMGVNAFGAIAAITNVRQGTPDAGTYRSRGELPTHYLSQHTNTSDFNNHLIKNSSRYRGYNLLYGCADQLSFFSNTTRKTEHLSPGVHGISNASLNTPWPKVTLGKQRLKEGIKTSTPDPLSLLNILNDETVAPDDQLPNTGVSQDLERQLSPILISGISYGTRSSSVIMVDKQNNFSVYEQERAPKRGPLKEFHFTV